MRAYENPVKAEILVRNAQARREKASDREPGIHQSDLTSCLRKSWLRMQSGASPDIADTADLGQLLTYLVGHGYHALLEEGDTEVKTKLWLGGGNIHCTIDYVPHDDPIPHEVKSTRYSSEKSLDDMGQYLDQLAVYCLARGSTRGRLIVLHLNGNYKESRQPVLRVWDIEFTREELGRYWSELDYRQRILQAPTIPAIGNHYTWECDYCPFGPKVGTGQCPGGKGRSTSFFVPDTLQDLEDMLV